MIKMEQTYCKMDDAKGAGSRIVFQLDLLEDKLRYCFWSDSPDEGRTEDTITDFRKSLYRCNIVHPDDLDVCSQILQKKSAELAVTTSEIRLRIGAAGYPKFRMYTISANDAHGNMAFINGVLEGIQTGAARSRRTKGRTENDSLFRKAITSHAILSMGFDCVTGNRLVSSTDVIPQWLPHDSNLKNLSFALFSQATHPEERYKLESLLEQNLARGATFSTTSFYFHLQFRDLTRQTQNLRWYHIHHSFIEQTPKQPACFYLTIIDIQEEKDKEQQQIEQSMHDPMTGMFNRFAYEKQVTHWLQRMKGDQGYPLLCAVILLVENTIEINHLYGRAYLSERIGQLGKTVKAFIHPHELCCRHGLGEFAMVLASNDMEIMKERLKMLEVACNAQEAETPAMRILIGHNMEQTMQTEYADLFLEKAYRALIWKRSSEAFKSVQVITEHTAPKNINSKKQDSIDSGDQQGRLPTNRVFIRTFGHFDVFVNGEAVLFNHPKAKELFALLVDRRGGFVSANEAISCLWEEEPSNKTTLARCRKAAMQMKQTLAQYGIDDIVETINGKRRALVDQCECDFDQYLHQGNESLPKMIGTYMNEYSWAENSISIE